MAKRDAVKTDMDPAVDAALAQEAAELKMLEEMDAQEPRGRVRQIPGRWRGGTLTDATPGDMPFDATYIPETVVTYQGVERRVATHQIIDGQLRILTADGRGIYRWTNPTVIPIRKRYGYVFSSFEKTFADTGLFERRQGDTVWNGDAVLMSISLDGWEKLREQKRALDAHQASAFGSAFFKQGEESGTPTFKDDLKRGTREFMT